MYYFFLVLFRSCHDGGLSNDQLLLQYQHGRVVSSCLEQTSHLSSKEDLCYAPPPPQRVRHLVD